MTAEIQVLRSCRISGEPLAVDRIQVHFLAYGPIMTPMLNATPLPSINSGDVLVLPLKENPQPSVADLLSGKAQPKDWRLRGSLFLAQVALQKLKASPETDALLIATTIADMPVHAWGSGNILLEFADNPATAEGVRKALRDDINGSSWVASVMVHNGHSSILPEALARALKVADRPDGEPGDLQGAASLLRDYGSDQDLKQLAALVRKYQLQDQKFYNILWQYSTEAGNPRACRSFAGSTHRFRRLSVLRLCCRRVGKSGEAGLRRRG